MKLSQRPFLDALVMVLATGLFSGYTPLVPGTAASAVAALAVMALSTAGARLGAAALFLAVGFLVAGRAERLIGTKDPRIVVIDEWAGVALALVWAGQDLAMALIAFLIFRVLDALKVFPAGRLQALSGSLGIMADDIIAGVYSCGVVFAVSRLVSLR